MSELSTNKLKSKNDQLAAFYQNKAKFNNWDQERLDKAIERNVGGSGYALEQAIILTGQHGEVVIKNEKGEPINNYWGFNSDKDGDRPSAERVMGTKSLRGYTLNGEFEVEYIEPKSGEKRVRKVYAKCVPNAEERRWVITEQTLADFVDALDASKYPAFKAGAKLVYLGTAVRPFTRRNDSQNFDGSEVYKAGMKGAMEVQLWALE